MGGWMVFGNDGMPELATDLGHNTRQLRGLHSTALTAMVLERIDVGGVEMVNGRLGDLASEISKMNK